MGTPDHTSNDCRRVSAILSRIGDKWSVLVVMLLGDGPRRFNEIKRMVHGISQRMLTLTLRGLERDGLVTRTIYASVPPKVEYQLTELGRSLRAPVQALGMWALNNADGIDVAREEFDSRNEQAAEQPAVVVHRLAERRAP
jgi:DNA-binding HxlR family transcriptional regulator